MLDNLTWMRKYQKRAMNEKESRNWMQAAHSCIAALQDHNLVHLDVKMENFVITPRAGQGNDVTLIDVQTVKTAPMTVRRIVSIVRGPRSQGFFGVPGK
jgi:aminoglycoside/choline kinase family phosphotransferase